MTRHNGVVERPGRSPGHFDAPVGRTRTAHCVPIAPDEWPAWRDRLPPRHDKAAFWTVEWLEAWAQAFLPYQGWRGPVTGLAVVRDGQVLGLLPLAVQRVGPLPVRSLAGPFSPYRTAPVVDDEAGRTAFADALARCLRDGRQVPVLRLGPTLASDPGVRTLADALLRTGWRGLFDVCGPALTIDLPAGEDELLKRASASLLKNLKYLERKLARDLGEITVTRHVIGGDSAGLVRAVGAIEARSWVAREGGETKFIRPPCVDFWARLGARPGAGSEAVVWLLSAGGTALSFSAHLETQRTVHVIANGYDEQWKAFSPGSLLSERLLLDACRRGRTWLNWGQGDSGYKARWGARADDRLVDLLFFHPGVVGQALFRLARWRLPRWHLLSAGGVAPF